MAESKGMNDAARDEPGGTRDMFTRPVSILLGLQMLSGMVVAPCVALLPVYLSELGFTAVLISGIFTIQRIAGLVASVGGGALTDSLGRKPTLVLGQLGFFAAALVFLFQRPVPVAILWGLSGAGLGLITLGGQSYLIDHANHRYLGVLTALYYWGHTLGSTLSNTATGLVLGRVSYAGLGTSLAIIGGATVVLCLLFLPSSGPPVKSHGSKDRLSYVAIARRPEILGLGILRFLPTFSYGVMTVFVPLLLKNAGATNRTVAFYAAVGSVLASLAQLIAGRAADRTTPKVPGLVSLAFVVGCPLVIAAYPRSLPLVFVMGVLALAAAWSLSTLIAPMVAGVAPPRERGRVLGFIHLFWNLGMILGAMVGGVLFQSAPSAPFVLSGAINIPSVVLLLWFFRFVSRIPVER